MGSRLLIIYWNELSFPLDISCEELESKPEWKQRAAAAFTCLLHALRSREEVRISFARGAFKETVGHRPLESWIEHWLGRDALRRIKGGTIQPVKLDGFQQFHDLEVELNCLGRSGDGITRAHIADTWTWSLGAELAGCNKELIAATRRTIDNDTEEEVSVRNFACSAHAAHWEADLGAWDKVTSANHVISNVDDYSIVMYPLDHGFPHVHVHYSSGAKLNAKYRVDRFECLVTRKRPNGLDELMRVWIEAHRDDLLTSWERCSRGRYPLKLPA